MAGEWEETTVGELVTQGILERPLDGNHGSIHPRGQDFVASGVPFIMASDLVGGGIDTVNCSFITTEQAKSLRKGFAKRGDVLLSHKATLGRTAIVGEIPGDFVMLTPQVTYYRAKDPTRLSNRYLKYYFDSELFQQVLRSWAGAGSTRAYIGITDQLRLPIVLPPLPEQRAIANILGTLDDKIEVNRRMNKTLEAMARALFKSWFVDFDPVRAKAQGRDPGLPKEIADRFPDSFDDSELGKIPNGWEVKAIEAIAKRVGMGPFGSSIKVETFVPEGVPVISGQHLHGFMVEDNTFNFVSHEHAERLRAANVQRGDVVFTHAGNIGQVAYIPENSRYDCYVISQRQFFMRCDLAQVAPSFVAFYFRSLEGQHRLLANASSSGVPSIARPVTYLRSIQLTIPPKPLIDAFEKSVQPLLTQFRRNMNEVNTLATLRDTLLPKLISGELRVKNVERGIAGVSA